LIYSVLRITCRRRQWQWAESIDECSIDREANYMHADDCRRRLINVMFDTM